MNMANSTSWEDIAPRRPRLSEVNPYITCMLCRGYLVDATTIVECLHSFCRSCIIHHLNVKCYCPVCELMINMAKPNIKPDKALQDIVYKLVPGLFEREMERRRAFYEKHPKAAALASPEQRGEDMERLIFSPDDKISISLEMTFGSEFETLSNCSSDSGTDSLSSSSNSNYGKRYLECPAKVKISHLKKFLIHKYDIDTTRHNVNVLYKRVPLPEFYTLMDTAYIYTWKRNEPMRFFYNFVKNITSINDFEMFKCTDSNESNVDNKLNIKDDYVDINNCETSLETQLSKHLVQVEKKSKSPEYSSYDNNEDSVLNNDIQITKSVNDVSKECSNKLEFLKSNDSSSCEQKTDLEKSQFLELIQLTAKKNCVSQKPTGSNMDMKTKVLTQDCNKTFGATCKVNQKSDNGKLTAKLDEVSKTKLPNSKNDKRKEDKSGISLEVSPKKNEVKDYVFPSKKISDTQTENKKSLIEILKSNISATMAKASKRNIALVNSALLSKAEVDKHEVKPVIPLAEKVEFKKCVKVKSESESNPAISQNLHSKIDTTDKESKEDQDKILTDFKKESDDVQHKIMIDSKKDSIQQEEPKNTKSMKLEDECNLSKNIMDIVPLNKEIKSSPTNETQCNTDCEMKEEHENQAGEKKSLDLNISGNGENSNEKQDLNASNDNTKSSSSNKQMTSEKKIDIQNLTSESIQPAQVTPLIGSSLNEQVMKNGKRKIYTPSVNAKRKKIIDGSELKDNIKIDEAKPELSGKLLEKKLVSNQKLVQPRNGKLEKVLPQVSGIKEDNKDLSSHLIKQNKKDTDNRANTLRNLIDSGYFKLPSSLSISLTESKDSVQALSGSMNINEMTLTEIKPEQIKSCESKKSSPVNNYIEILKLPEQSLKSDEKTSKLNLDGSHKSPGPIPNLKPIDSKLSKSTTNPPQTFQQTFLQSLQQIDAMRFLPKSTKSKTESCSTNPGAAVKSPSTSTQKSSKGNIVNKTLKCAKSDIALDLSSPSNFQSKLSEHDQNGTKTLQVHNSTENMEAQMALQLSALFKSPPANLISSSPNSSPPCEYSRPGSTSTLMAHPYNKQVSKLYGNSKAISNLNLAAPHLTPFAQQAFLYQQLKINQLESTFSTAAMIQFVRSLQAQNKSPTNTKKSSQQHGNMYSPKSK